MGHWGTCPLEFDARTNFSLYFGEENRIFIATRSVLWPKICRKCNSGWGSAPYPAGGAHDAPPDPLVDWGADALSIPTPVGAFWRLDARAFGASFVVPPLTPNPGDATDNKVI